MNYVAEVTYLQSDLYLLNVPYCIKVTASICHAFHKEITNLKGGCILQISQI